MGALVLEGRPINRVAVVDDDPDSREALAYALEDLGVTPLPWENPHDVSSLVAAFQKKGVDAVLSDFHLKKHAYADFNGDSLLAACFVKNMPGLLCTSYSDIDDEIDRRLLRFIPSIHDPSPQPQEITASYSRCLREMKGLFHPTRRAWRSPIRVTDVEKERPYFHVVLPGWNPVQKIRLYFASVDEVIHKAIRPDAYLHAQVNIGAERHEDLYFYDWEAE